MFFTQEDYRKIYDWIKIHSIKDSEFSDSKPLNGRETITVVQQGHNVKFILQDFLEQLALLNIPDFVNVTERYDLKYISLFEATKAVPYRSRKIGQVITFLDEDGNWKIYQFRGEKRNQWSILTLWVDILQDIINKGNILPDEEDLTSVTEGDKTVVKFKDKAYNPDNFSGLGRVYLRKNITQVSDPTTLATKTVNLLTQSMISKEDTIYIIQYDYDLNGQTITIPKGCTLKFEGGSLNNGSIDGNSTLISAKRVKIFGNDITIKDRTFKNDNSFPEWFDENVENASYSIQKCLDAFYGVSLGSKKYTLNKPIYLHIYNKLYGVNSHATALVSKVSNGYCIYCNKNNEFDTVSTPYAVMIIENISIAYGDTQWIDDESITYNKDCNCIVSDGFIKLRNIFFRYFDKILYFPNYSDVVELTNIYCDDRSRLSNPDFNPISSNNWNIKWNESGDAAIINCVYNCQFSFNNNANVLIQNTIQCGFYSYYSKISYDNGHNESPELYPIMFVGNVYCAINNLFSYVQDTPPIIISTDWSTGHILIKNTIFRCRYTDRITSCIQNVNGVELNIENSSFSIDNVGSRCITLTNGKSLPTTCHYVNGYIYYNEDSVGYCTMSTQNIDTDNNVLNGNISYKIYNIPFNEEKFAVEYCTNSLLGNGKDVKITLSSSIRSEYKKLLIVRTIGDAEKFVIISPNIAYDNSITIIDGGDSLRYDNIEWQNYNNEYSVVKSFKKDTINIITSESYEDKETKELSLILRKDIPTIHNNDEHINIQTICSSKKENLPSGLIGFCYFDTIINKPFWWNGNSYITFNSAAFYNQNFQITNKKLLCISDYSGPYDVEFIRVNIVKNGKPLLYIIANKKDSSGSNFENINIYAIVGDNSFSFYKDDSKIYLYNSNDDIITTHVVIESNRTKEFTIIGKFGEEELSSYSKITTYNNYGTSYNRLSNSEVGLQYFDTTINKPIWWNGTEWVDSEGNDADSTPITSGTFANKPTGIDVGYAYFCTDKQTTEGTANGIMIYYKGDNIWVDALGRVVS